MRIWAAAQPIVAGSPYNRVLWNLPLRIAPPVEFPAEGPLSCLPQPLTSSMFRRAGVTLF